MYICACDAGAEKYPTSEGYKIDVVESVELHSGVAESYSGRDE